MDKVFTIIQLVLAIFLIVAVLLQQRGSGLGSAFGGGGSVYSTRRGMDKILFQITIVIAILFFVAAILNLLY
ncbi:MAG TPA: preprotein translocase subunit SecG [Candidatus Magasanikbacteria bacterium]|jgi:preprotein translocase subunit SecG|nr:preprotein translocase subunit SecG [Candidatus Magasanikbacteria bacterium]HQF57273.1 preprotein translocase subunit SecG [Candidatus Magasanikbacteria bacterium]HQL52599.1 preprotein translocase subunit SecG [Candidatus Magasanikbacteria bacterium]